VESDTLKENVMFAIDKIICPTDFSEPSYEGLKTAIEIADHFSAELILVHIVSPLPNIVGAGAPTGFHLPMVLKEMEKQATERIEADAAERIPNNIKFRTVVGTGRPADRIVQAASEEKAQIIVMATHGQSGWQRFVSGSETERVIRLANCPVYVVPAPDES
jgi:nucleotide-binding universal stress UspA family protein